MPSDIHGGKGAQTPVASGDYKSVDPTPITLYKSNASSFTITVTPTAQTGTGNTVTVTVTDADTTKQLDQFTVTGAAVVKRKVVLSDAVHRVTVTPVGSGTRTTLNYSVSVTWDDLNYAGPIVFDGKAYVNSDKHNA